MKFLDLVAQISEVDGAARVAATRSLQQILTLRNWVIGASIVEFEQDGEDRAGYGQRLIPRLADALSDAGCTGLSARNLHNFRRVALAFPGIDAVDLGYRLGLPPIQISQAPAKSDQARGILQAPAGSAQVPFPSLVRRATEDQELPWRDTKWLARLFTGLTFTHLVELARIDDPNGRLGREATLCAHLLLDGAHDDCGERQVCVAAPVLEGP